MKGDCCVFAGSCRKRGSLQYLVCRRGPPRGSTRRVPARRRPAGGGTRPAAKARSARERSIHWRAALRTVIACDDIPAASASTTRTLYASFACTARRLSRRIQRPHAIAFRRGGVHASTRPGRRRRSRCSKSRRRRSEIARDRFSRATCAADRWPSTREAAFCAWSSGWGDAGPAAPSSAATPSCLARLHSCTAPRTRRWSSSSRSGSRYWAASAGPRGDGWGRGQLGTSFHCTTQTRRVSSHTL